MYVLYVFRGIIQTHMHSAYHVHMYTPKCICLYVSVLYVYVCMFKIIHFRYIQIQQIHTHAYTYIPYILYIPIHTIQTHTYRYISYMQYIQYIQIHPYIMQIHTDTYTYSTVSVSMCLYHACIMLYMYV